MIYRAIGLIIALCITASPVLAQDCGWDSMDIPDRFPGVTGQIKAAVIHDDGSGPALFIGGFSSIIGADGRPIHGIAKWNGQDWVSIGAIGSVWTMTVFDDGSGPMLYAAGQVSDPDSGSGYDVAKWDGESWTFLGAAMDGPSEAMGVYDAGNGPELYVGGWFDQIGETVVNHVCRWDGTTWQGLGEGTDHWVSAFAVFDAGAGPELYVGGWFSNAGGQPTSGLARWNGQTWTAMQGPDSSSVETMAVFDDGTGPALYIGGTFDPFAGNDNAWLTRWDGNTWTMLESDLNARVYDLAVFDDGQGQSLYATGFFTQAGNVSAKHIAKWDGQEWSAVGAGVASFKEYNLTRCLTVGDIGQGNMLFLGGQYTYVDNVLSNGIAAWDGTQWSAFEQGVYASLRTLEVFDDGQGPALYVGGAFTSLQGVPLNNIARWDGSSWTPLGEGIRGEVETIKTLDLGDGPALYVGGRFDTAGGQSASNVAKWDGNQWTPVGINLDRSLYKGSVLDLEVVEEGGIPLLFAVGQDLMIEDLGQLCSAQWDGTTWQSDVEQRSSGWLSTLHRFDDQSGLPALYTGGEFLVSDPFDHWHMLRWDKGQWTPISSDSSDISGFESMHSADLGDGLGLYVSAWRMLAPGGIHSGIARWIDNTFLPLGESIRGRLMALTATNVDGTNHLFAAGQFPNAARKPANSIAGWDGTRWYSLGRGLERLRRDNISRGRVHDIAAFDDGSGPALYAAGDFTFANGTQSRRLARWNLCPPCHPDLNSDGNLNIIDFITFLNAYNDQDELADYNRDGIINTLDFLAFLDAYNAGC